MITLTNFIHNLIAALTSLRITERKIPELIPVRVITKAYRDNLK